MDSFGAIDAVLLPWAQTRGLHVYKGHVQNPVRSVTMYVWIGARHESTGHLWLDAPSDLGLVGLHAAYRHFRMDEAVPPGDLDAALEKAENALMAQKLRDMAE